MKPSDPRGADLRAFDALAADFAADCARRYDLGDQLAAEDTERLARLARRLIADTAAWAAALEALAVARLDPPPPPPCAGTVVEQVFDFALTPMACRLLAAAVRIGRNP